MEDLSTKRNGIREVFREAYGREPRVFRAPGRVNFIGEHTDYNEGFVLPFAIDRETLMAGTPRLDTKINIRALDVNDSISFDLRDAAVKRRGKLGRLRRRHGAMPAETFRSSKRRGYYFYIDGPDRCGSFIFGSA